MERPKIFITGGHLTPAVAVLDLLIQKGWTIWYIGRKYAQEEDQSISVEYQTLQSYKGKVKFLLITTGKLQRYFSFKSFLSLIKIPIGFIQSIYWLIKYRPKIILSFGGYVATPVCLLAWVLGIPIITHEQTRSPGFANKLIGNIARKICLTWEETKVFFDTNKVIITGLPIRGKIFQINKSIPVNLNKPLIYVSGGSLGSHSINLLLFPIIGKLVNGFSIIHQCGDTKKYNDYQQLVKIKENLPTKLKANYYPINHINEDYLGWLYKNASFSLARSGANTVYEFAACGVPTIFIPIPWSSGNEQYYNAKFFKDYGAGIILDQYKINSEKLYKELMLFKENLKFYKNNANRLKQLINLNGADNLVGVLEQELKK